MNKTILAISGASVVGLVVFILVQFSNVSVKKDGGVSVEVGAQEAEAGCYQDGRDCLPPFDFTDVSGKTWTPEALAGKVVVINFWASWCKPCQHEIPALAAVQRKYKDQVVILGLMTDEPSDAKLKSFRSQFGLDYPVVRVDRAISQSFDSPRNLPTNFVYSKHGHLKFERAGAISAGDLEREIKELL